MFKYFLFALTIFLYVASTVAAQTTSYPSSEILEKNYLKEESFTMKLYAWKDSVKIPLGTMESTIEINKEKQQLLYIQKLRLGAFTNDWIDSTVINVQNFAPLYHSSRKQGEETILHFNNNTVQGTWNVLNKLYPISDSSTAPFFDYHVFPVLICCLPLVEGGDFETPVYDFIPGKSGMTKVSITNIQTVDRAGKKLVKVTTKEHTRPNSGSVFFIDPTNHQLMQVDISKGDKKTQMIRELPGTL